jgi:single-stranded-DNA-specific exonuclease
LETVWKLKKTPINDAQELAEQLVIPVPVANVMIQRGIDTPELAREFFDLSPEKLHDPWLLPDIHKVIDRLEKAINEKEYIYIQKEEYIYIFTKSQTQKGFSLSMYIHH